jgi:lipopolysaccharide/colanic/teichoic acid biosynthesis glycosyltransferase
METAGEVRCIAISLPASETRLDQNYLTVKRALDIVLAAAFLVVVSPIILLCCLAVALESPGLPLFTQVRVGARGQRFRMLKIRTMQNGTDRLSVVTMDDDPRITRLGRFLRATKLDELPQLINIIKGDMSVIGPRPLSEVECEHMVSEDGIDPQTPGFVPQTLPGLIGLEQVNRSHKLTYEERFDLNSHYERNISWVMDFDILLRAVHQCRVVVYAAIIAFSSESILITLFGG